MTPARNTVRYRNDPAYRAEFIRKVNARHYRNMAHPTYQKLTRARKQIYNFRESIAVYRRKIGRLQCRLKEMVRRKEALEIAWGQERARRKAA